MKQRGNDQTKHNRPRQSAEGRARGRRKDRQAQLDVEQIIDAAITIADRDGPDAITMRAVARELDVGVMSLYWHVPSKRQLEGMLLGRMLEEAAPSAEPTDDWREDLASVARSARHNLLRHPWVVDLFSSITFEYEAVLTHGFLRHIESTLRMVDGLPLDFETKISIHTILDDFAMGFTFGEITEGRRLEAMGVTEEELHRKLGPQLQEMLAEGDYPRFTYYIQHDHELPDKETQFENALQIILDGIEVQLERARAAEND